MRKFFVGLFVLLSVNGWSAEVIGLHPKKVSAEVWKEYEGYSCNWSKLEFRRLEREAKRIVGIQEEEKLVDETMFVWEWVPSVTPYLLLDANKGKKEALEVILGKKEALEQAFRRKEACISTDPNAFQISSPFTL